MRRRVAPTAALTCLALVCAVAAAACDGSGDAPTVESYFADLQALDDGQQEASEALAAELAALGRLDVAGGVDITHRQNDLRQTFVDHVEDIETPDEVAALHDETVTSLHGEIDAYQAFIEEAEDASTLEDLLVLLPKFDNEAVAAAQTACTALETYAATKSIDLDLDCSEPP